MSLLAGRGPELIRADKVLCACDALRSGCKTQIRRTVLGLKAGEKKQMAESSTTRPRLGDILWFSIAETRSADGRTTVVSTGIVVELAGACLAQQGCCASPGIAGNLTVTNRVVANRG